MSAPWNGHGEKTYKNGHRYVGQFKNGKRDGKGKLYFSDGNRYEGEFKDDRMHGEGTFIWAHGSRYEGEFKHGNFHGKGTKTGADGSRFEGEWKDDKMHGKGTYRYANGDRYEGEWKDDKMHGNGTKTYANGNRYEGEWKDGKPRGWGVFYLKDGRKHAGEWIYDGQAKLHGLGVRLAADGRVQEMGEFRDGKLVSSRDVQDQVWSHFPHTEQFKKREREKREREAMRLREEEEEQKKQKRRQEQQALQTSRLRSAVSQHAPSLPAASSSSVASNPDDESRMQRQFEQLQQEAQVVDEHKSAPPAPRDGVIVPPELLQELQRTNFDQMRDVMVWFDANMVKLARDRRLMSHIIATEHGGNPALRDFYHMFRLRVMRFLFVNQAMYGHIKGAGSDVSSDVDMLSQAAEFALDVGKEVPLLGPVAKVVAKLYDMMKDRKHRPNVNKTALFCLSPSGQPMESFVELLALRLALLQSDDMLRRPSSGLQSLLGKMRNKPVISRLKSLWVEVKADDADTPAKMLAVDEAQLLMQLVIAGTVTHESVLDTVCREVMLSKINKKDGKGEYDELVGTLEARRRAFDQFEAQQKQQQASASSSLSSSASAGGALAAPASGASASFAAAASSSSSAGGGGPAASPSPAASAELVAQMAAKMAAIEAERAAEKAERAAEKAKLAEMEKQLRQLQQQQQNGEQQQDSNVASGNQMQVRAGALANDDQDAQARLKKVEALAQINQRALADLGGAVGDLAHAVAPGGGAGSGNVQAHAASDAARDELFRKGDADVM